MKKRSMSILLIMALIVTMFTSFSFAASKTKKMKVYNGVVKSGNYAYVNANYKGIWKVNLKKSVNAGGKCIAEPTSSDLDITDMRIYKGYLYYLETNESSAALYRIKLKTGKKYKLISCNSCVYMQYAISKSRLYVSYDDGDKEYKKVMKLNGKSKKNTKYNAVNSYGTSNSKYYKLVSEVDDGEEYFYLNKLNKKKKLVKSYYVCCLTIEDYDDEEYY